jgi:hypothetical protein
MLATAPGTVPAWQPTCCLSSRMHQPTGAATTTAIVQSVRDLRVSIHCQHLPGGTCWYQHLFCVTISVKHRHKSVQVISRGGQLSREQEQGSKHIQKKWGNNGRGVWYGATTEGGCRTNEQKQV